MAFRKELTEEKDDFLAIFGAHVRDVRLSKDMSAADLASLCEVAASTISRIENGKQNPTIFFVKRISDALEINLSELLKDIEKRY